MAETPAPSGALTELLKMLGPWAPGFAGSVLALAFLENLTPRGRALAVVVGLAAAVFLAPLLAAVAGLFWPGDLPGEVRSGIAFLTGLSAMGALPPLLAWIRRVAGDPFSLLRRLPTTGGSPGGEGGGS